jgi:hypothetical protein
MGEDLDPRFIAESDGPAQTTALKAQARGWKLWLGPHDTPIDPHLQGPFRFISTAQKGSISKHGVPYRTLEIDLVRRSFEHDLGARLHHRRFAPRIFEIAVESDQPPVAAVV